MLTKTDLSQVGKLVRKIVREEVEAEVKNSTHTLENQIRLSRMQVQNEISELNDRMKNVEIKVDGVGKDVKDVKARVRKTEKTVDVMAKLFDKEDVSLAKRVRRIENHLSLPQI